MTSGVSALRGGRVTHTKSKSRTIIEQESAVAVSEKLLAPVHPGEILREDFMKPCRLSVNRLAIDLHVPATRIGEIVHGRRRITADTALRLARYFRTNPEFWLNLQNFYDLELSKRSGVVSEIDREVRPSALAS
jgi:antitoxin HigA-1